MVDVVLIADTELLVLVLLVLLLDSGDGVGAVMAKVLAVDDEDREAKGFGGSESGPSVLEADEVDDKDSSGVGGGESGPNVLVVIVEDEAAERVLEIDTSLALALEVELEVSPADAVG